MRHWVLSDEKRRRFGLLWQAKTDRSIYVTWVASDFGGHETVKLKGEADAWLAAGTDGVDVGVLERRRSHPARECEQLVLRALLLGVRLLQIDLVRHILVQQIVLSTCAPLAIPNV